MTPLEIVTMITTFEPLVAPLVADFITLLKKHPTLTPEQAMALFGQVAAAIHATNADSVSTVLADQAAHPKV